jgi:mRNA interferase MazF
VVISQGDVWWADLPSASGSASAFRRPVVVVQGDAFNESAIRTVVCVAVTSNLRWADSPGNVLLPARATGLRRESVANVTQVVTLDKSDLTERAGKLSRAKLELVLEGLETLVGR